VVGRFEVSRRAGWTGAAWIRAGALAALLAACEPGPAVAPTAPAQVQSAAVSAAPSEVELERLRARVAELELALAEEREGRLKRERAWLRYTQAVSALERLSGVPSFESPLAEAALVADAAAPTASTAAAATQGLAPGPSATDPSVSGAAQPAEPAPAAPDPAALASAERSRAVFVTLRSMFALEQVSGLDLLDSGIAAEGGTGPVVLRVLDERGRPLGSLYADRLRLEASRAARTLTLVLERGWERRAGEQIPFEGAPPDAEGRGGVRRIELPHVDPTPWIEALPELFRAEDLRPLPPANRAALEELRLALNRLLERDASGAVHRVEALGALEAGHLRDVHIAVFSAPRVREKELLADRLVILRAERGLELSLEGGSQLRGSQKLPFLGGRYRVFLPRAVAADWEAAGIPIAPGPGGG
jgi:hypothetical protein